MPIPSLSSRLKSHAPASRSSNRQLAFLPQRGAYNTKYFHSSEHSLNVQQSIHTGIQHARRPPCPPDQAPSTNSDQREQGSYALPTRTMRLPDAVSRPLESQPAISRSQSLRKPATATQAASSAATRAHIRTQSTNTIAGPPKVAAETKLQSGRPRSLLIAPGHSTKSISQAPANVLPGTNRSSARLEALKRSSSTRARSESIPVSETTNIGLGLATQNGVTQPGRRREVVKEESKKSARPAFSTLQQHFTPRKTGKAPTSAFLNPPAPDAGSLTLPPDIISLQAELLQLHILHDNSAQVSSDWNLSAKRTLHVKFDEVASLYHVMHENEREGQEQKNVRALREWSSGNTSFGLVEQIQVLSGPLHELPSIVDPSGRFRRVVDEFSLWIARVEEIWAKRKNDATVPKGDLSSTEGLNGAWRAENAALTRKLTTFARDLDRLTQPDPDSSIAKVVATCKEILSGVLEELQIMQSVEAAVVDSEKEWVEARLKSMATIGPYVDMNEGHEAWRA
ncbi:hypothetical protein B0J11DRAFT_549649 [Dendryphion nanum]|uniref:Uncharacterized protein n=1 Tax=Dendryphion nanum TaxID=256645 RepID=A0A9P9DV86_9PLEO|nr:hypothetical protein B0J11DRAFT_549649 [Dendryphion nanum]